MHKSRLALVPGLLSGAIAAQTTTTVSVTDVNMVFGQSALSAASNSYVFGTLRSTGATGTNHLFSSWWWYRLPGDTMEWAFRNDAAPNAPTRTAVSPTITTTWPNVRGAGKISAVLADTVVSTGPSSGFLRRTMTITNLDAVNPLTIDVFAYADLDTAGNCCPNSAFGDGKSHYVERLTFTPGAEFFCADADRTQVSPWQTATAGSLPFVLTNTTVENLSNAWNPVPFSDDYNGAFQWTRTIPPSGSSSFVVYLGVTANATTSMPVSAIYGVSCAGIGGPPAISQNQMAMIQTGSVPRSIEIRLSNALPNVPALLLQSFNSGNSVLVGLTIHVDMTALFESFYLTTGGGAATQTVSVPPNPSLLNVSLYSEWLSADPTSVCSPGLAVHTSGLQTRVGGWQ